MPTMTKAGYVPPKKEPPKAEPPKPAKKHKKKHKNKHSKKRINTAGIVSLVIFAIAALIGAATIFIYTQTQAYMHAFLPGTMLLGYPMGGASYAQGEALLDQIEQERVALWKFELTCMGQTYTVTAQDVSLAIDREATLAPLWAAGREGGMVAQYIEMLRLWKEPMNASPVLTYDLVAVDALLETIRQDVECDPVDATVSFAPGSAEPFRFTREEIGYSLDFSGIREGIELDICNLAPSSVTLEPKEIEPAAYRAEMENAISLRARLTVKLDDNEASQANARIAAAMFNGVTVGPDEMLSFNETVGRRTAEGGYQAAPEPAYGENVSGVGGGVCQVSTALYRAALIAGLDVTQRNAAARPVDYCGMGQEATVSDQGLDLVIHNPTEAPLFMMSRVYEDDEAAYLELTLFGMPMAHRFAIESIVEETGLIEEPVYVRDHDGTYAAYSDERVPVGEAQMGYVARVERVKLDENGAEISREAISEDVYEAVPPTIYVGMKEREE